MLTHNPVSRTVEGQRYSVSMPDTLDIADRLGLAINALTHVWYPAERWALGFDVDFSRRPSILYTNHLTDAYLNIPAKFLEALVLSRLASGSQQNLDVDARVIDAQLGLIGDDGLSYCPTDTLPKLTEKRPFAEVWGEGRLLLAISMLQQVDNGMDWAAVGKRKIDRMLSLTEAKDNFRYLWKGRFRPGESKPLDIGEPTGGLRDGSLLDRYENPKMSVLYSTGALGHGAGLFYRVTGYEPALDLARGLAHWAVARIFDNADGRWDVYHFHHSLYSLMTVCEYAYAAGDRALLDRVDACYRWAREMGDPLIGFYAECMPGSDCYLKREGNTVEICEVSDMVFLALYLTNAGIADYWDDVDRWVRNMYAEGQMLHADFLAQIPDSYFTDEPSPRPYQDRDNVAQRSVGSFFGWMRANDGLDVKRTEEGNKLSQRGIMHCCTANGARTLYFVWDSIVTRGSETIHVNLLLNRVSPWVDVSSYLPVEGKVVLNVKQASRIRVRIPGWCDLAQLTVDVDSAAQTVNLDGRWLILDGLREGSQVTIRFPIGDQVLFRVIGEIPYKLVLRGANVVSIDPQGMAYPLFQDQPTGQLVSKSRFIPNIREIVW